MLENNRVKKRNRRHKHKTSDKHHRNPKSVRSYGLARYSAGFGNLFGDNPAVKKRGAADHLHERENFLRCILLVGDRTDNRREKRAERKSRIKESNVYVILAAETAERVRPASPNREFKRVRDLKTEVHERIALAFCHGFSPKKSFLSEYRRRRTFCKRLRKSLRKEITLAKKGDVNIP